MRLNQSYIDNLKIIEIPWSRLATPYGSAEDFPAYLRVIGNAVNYTKEQLDWAVGQIASEIEHQSTLWPVTPFAMVFLMRIFKESVLKRKENKIFYYLADKLLGLFVIVAKSYDMAEEMEHSQPLSDFSDMLGEEYLWPEECDEDDMDYNFPDDLFYSFYYYSYQILLRERDFFEQLKDSSLENIADILAEIKNRLSFS